VNSSFAENIDLSKISKPVAQRIVRKRPFMNGIDAGRIPLRIVTLYANFLKKRSNATFRHGKVKKCKEISIASTIICTVQIGH
jgi:hypothetical protein